MKLSRTGWNNVIIFAIIGFILLINATNNKLFNKKEPTVVEQTTIFAQHDTILTLYFYPNVTIERMGKTWRATPDILNEQALEQMMRSWKNTEGSSVQKPPRLDEKMALIVKVSLAAQNQPQTMQLYVTDTELLIFNKTTQLWLSFPLAIFSQLVPNEIFSA